MKRGKRLLVQGSDEYHALSVLLERNGIFDVSVDPHGGIDELVETAAVLLKGTGVDCWGIVIDGGSQPRQRWIALDKAFRAAGYDALTKRPSEAGTIVATAGRARVGIWIMPDNGGRGTLDDFLTSLIPDDDLLLAHVDAVLDAIPSSLQLFSRNDMPKARLRTWLAWQKSPGIQIRQALNSPSVGIDPRSIPARAFCDWAVRLFDDCGTTNADDWRA